MSFWKKKEKKGVSPPIQSWKITRKCLTLILEASKANYPMEFGGFLRADTQQKDTIREIVLLPGTISGDSHAIFQMHMLPIDFSIVGTVHSHPSVSAHPSDADLHLFEKYGKIHIIVAQPYTETSWRAYRYTGEEVSMTVV